MYYNFKNMEWNILSDHDPKKKLKNHKLFSYKYMGKTYGEDGMTKIEFKYWNKNGKMYVDVLDDNDPKYFVEIDNLSNLEHIENKYLKKDDCKVVGQDSIMKVHNESIERAKNYERFDPDIDNDNFYDFYMGSVKSVDDVEKSMIIDECVYSMPLRLSTAKYSNKNDTPKMSVFKTYLSKSRLELYFFDKSVNEDGYFPLFCRAIYDNTMPVDVKKYIDKNSKLELDEYLDITEKSGNHMHNLGILNIFRDHETDEYIKKYDIKPKKN